MTETRGVWIAIAVALIGAAGTIIAALIAGSGHYSPSPSVPTQVSTGGTTAPSPGPILPPTRQLVPSTSAPARPPSGPQPSLLLYPAAAPAGTVVRAYGTGFEPGERVVLSLETEQIGSTIADGAGKFSNVAVTIPQIYLSPFESRYLSVTVVGESSTRSGQSVFILIG